MAKLTEGAGLGTRAIHAGQPPEPTPGAVMVPVFQTSTYAQPSPGVALGGHEYARTCNPTRTALQDCIASLEGGKHGVCFSSGLGAVDAIARLLRPGDRVVSGDDVYGGTWRLFKKIIEPMGVRCDFIDLNTVALETAIPEGTRLVWLESPTNPLLKCFDLQVIIDHAHKAGALVAVDNTFATPIFQRPLEFGADFVLHSTTKYLNGHSDVVGGVVITNSDALHEQLCFIQNSVGAVPGPWDCFLTLRGLKTLHVRMAQHQRSGMAIAEWLVDHPEVERVHYPLLPSDPNYEIAQKQMSGFGGMVSFVLKGDLARAEKFVSSTRYFTLAESLGGVESLIELPAIMTHASVPPENRAELGIDDGLIRLSVGIEDLSDLKADLEQAFIASRS